MTPSTPKRCHLVQYDSADYARCLELRNRVLREPLGLQFTPEEREREPAAFHIACFEGEQLLGAAQLIEEGSWLRMRQVAVEPQRQRQGVGLALLTFCEQLAQERGFQGIYCHARNTAIAFYTAHGYACEGEEFEEVGIAHRVMRKGWG